MDDLKVGNVVKGTVTGIQKYGIFVKLNDEYSGLIHISEISEKYVKDVNNYAKVGEKIFVEINSIDTKKKTCILTVKGLNYRIVENPKIRESVRGFTPLKQHLPIWIDEKIKEWEDE
jgi:predicted RNA-binding protein with RPS1 domain